MFEKEIKKVNFNQNIQPIDTASENIVRKYVDPQYFNVEKMISYLNTHDVVGFDIFKNCIIESTERKVTWTFLRVFKPVNRDTFVRRIQIYFYDLYMNSPLQMTDFFNGYKDYMSEDYSDNFDFFDNDYDEMYHYPNGFSFDELYDILEKVIFDYKIPMEKVLKYLFDQCGRVGDFDIFLKWYDYIRLVNNLNEDNVFPKNILYSYNVELINNGKEPIMYYPAVTKDGKYVASKKGNSFFIGGYFPADENGKLAKQWIAIWTQDDLKISNKNQEAGKFDKITDSNLPIHIPALRKTIRINLKENTKIFIGNYDVLDSSAFGDDCKYREYWTQYYVGPKCMELNYKIFQSQREKLKLSSKDVAEATNINIRTYQRFESGESTPDGLSLIKLMNYLNIEKYEDLVLKYTFNDPGFEKFRSGNNIDYYLNSAERSEVCE